jgi:dTMP kinase
MARGKLIVFEGLDRAGKSTQCAMLAQALQEAGHSVRLMRFPGEYFLILRECSVVEGGISIGNFSDIAMTDRTTPIGQMINSYLSGQSEAEDHVIHLLFSANRWEAVYVFFDIRTRAGTDRSSSSIKNDVNAGTTVIVDRYYYSGCVYSAAKQNPSLSLEWCRQPDVGLPRPDLCLFLDIAAEDAAKRGGYGTEKYEKKEMQDRVRELFETLMQKKEGEDFVRVDAGRSMEEVQKKIRDEVERCLGEEERPLRVVGGW